MIMIIYIIILISISICVFFIIFKKSEKELNLDYFDITTYKTTININDFKEGAYIKCVTDDLKKYKKGRIYQIEKIKQTIALDGFEYLTAIISGDILIEMILLRSSSKFLVFTNWKNYFIPKFTWFPTSEEINFVLATDYEIRAQTYNI